MYGSGVENGVDRGERTDVSDLVRKDNKDTMKYGLRVLLKSGEAINPRTLLFC
jgi:hypothetical protein